MSDQPDLAAEYAPRIARVRGAMQAVNADLLVVDQAELMQWLGGFTSSETLYRVLLVPAQGEPWYVIRDIDRAPCVNASWVSDIVSYEDENNPFTTNSFFTNFLPLNLYRSSLPFLIQLSLLSPLSPLY